MSTAVAIIESREVTITPEQDELITRTICQGATPAEKQLFFYDCKRRGVHPLDKLIHFTKRQGKYTPITSIDFLYQRAQSTERFAGQEPTKYEGAPGTSGFEATVTIYKLVDGTPRPWTATARWSEYFPGDAQGFMWKKMPNRMLEKCAEALVLRKAFPAELHGLYVKEEMDQAGEERKPLRLPSEILADSERADAPPAGAQDRQQEDNDHREAETSGPSGSVKMDAPAAPNDEHNDDPAELYRVKLRTCQRDPQTITHTYNAIPEEARQDCHAEFQAQLRGLKKK